MTSERQSESQRRIKILDYLRENSIGEKAKKINKSDIMRYMQDTSRVMTTHKIITDLIKEGKITMKKDKPHSQTHYLVINENNEFNKFNQELLNREKQIEKLQIPKAKKPLNVPDEDAIMWDLLLRLGMIKKFPFEKDSELLERKIIKLMLALSVKKVRSIRETKE